MGVTTRQLKQRYDYYGYTSSTTKSDSHYDYDYYISQEDACLPTPRALLVTLQNTTILRQRRAQSQAVVVLQNSNEPRSSYSGGSASGMCCMPPLPRAIASSIPISNSNISGFVVLIEPLVESLTNVCPSCVVIGHRPVPAVSSTPHVNIHHPPPPSPAPVPAVLPHSHSSQGLMMFGVLMENEPSLVGVPGSVANGPPPQPMNHHHNPVVLHSSGQHQPYNAMASHALIEDLPPPELCDP